jgi:putative DNA primase/helicase
MNDQQDFTVGDKAPKPRKPRIVNMLALVDHINITPAWSGALRFNLLTQNYENCPPFPPEGGAKQSPRPFDDPHDLLLATMYFQANGFAKANKTVVWDAITAVAHEYAYHPVRDYLNSLQWDGVERVGKLFQYYFRAKLPDDPAECDRLVAYLDHASRCFLVSAVARPMQPGCKADYIPVIVGLKQGQFKSTALRALCYDPAWFSDDISTDLIDRDTKESLSGKWIIELAEIPHIRRETEKMKAFFSRREDRYRAAYGRGSKDYPRQGVFIGTSNDLEFVDVTGNRRFWPFISEGVDIEAIECNRDQLWAEAVHLYRQGVQWWLPTNIENIANEQQEAFVETDVWDEPISTWLRQRNYQPFTIADLFAHQTGIRPFRDTVETSKADEMRASRCLKRLRWYRSQCTLNGKRAYWWKPL